MDDSPLDGQSLTKIRGSSLRIKFNITFFSVFWVI